MNQLLTNPKYSSMVDEIKKYFVNLEGKTILEVGCDGKGELITYLAKQFNPKEIIGLNMAVQDKIISQNSRFVKCDIRKTSFPSNHFDYIYSLAAFEHIHNLGKALKEMYRILKPGGLLYSKFGPIWSSSIGHHLWIKHDNLYYTYKNVELHPYCHLLIEPKELENNLLKRYNQEITYKMIQFIYFSKDQNRLFYEDYEKLIKKSSFTNVFFYGTANFPNSENQLSENYIKILKNLQNKYKKYKNFSYNVIWMLLEKE